MHNLAVPVSNLISSVFRAADMDTTIAFVTKDGAFLFFESFEYLLGATDVSRVG